MIPFGDVIKILCVIVCYQYVTLQKSVVRLFVEYGHALFNHVSRNDTIW